MRVLLTLRDKGVQHEGDLRVIQMMLSSGERNPARGALERAEQFFEGE